MAFKKNGHQQQIRAFLDYTYAKENTLAFVESYGLMPVTKDTLAEMTGNDRHADLAPFLYLLPRASFYPLGDTTWDTVSAEIRKNVGTAVKDDPSGWRPSSRSRRWSACPWCRSCP
ncbi:hypothetical protein [Kitasatospora herbaricolor]|uniref:Uncharacterized protein n=1 Tax=Kitasatospora herbaricolor TaxID=68217 RepID=A0ABZ1W2L0_9ACTN|nr:hypothetical protein [Kitasatospora herbaricolor]